MKMTFLILISFIFISCGKQSLSDVVGKSSKSADGQSNLSTFSQSDSVFSPYIESFEKYGQKYLQNPHFKVTGVTINFVNQLDVSGRKAEYRINTKEIVVIKSWWDVSSEEKKEMMIFHELAHHQLNRLEHVDIEVTISGKRIKYSILNQEIPTAGDYNSFKEHYLQELFLRTSSYVK
jgi:hypothetical protein